MKKMIATLSTLTLLATMTAPTFAASNTVKEGAYTLVKTNVVVNGKNAYTPYVFAAKDPNSGVMTTFIPIWYVMQVMTKAGVTNSWNGVTHTLTLSGKSATLSIHGTKGNATITLNGKTVESGVPSFAVVDPNSGKLTTFFGLYYAEKLLDAMGFTNKWNGISHVWTITPPSGNTTAGTQKATSSSDGNMQVVPPGTETSIPVNAPITGFNQ